MEKLKKSKKELLIYIVFTISLCFFSYITIYFSGYQKKLLDLWSSLYHPLWLVFPVSILQEIIFRGWLMPILKKKFSNVLQVIILNALIFASVHAVFPYREFLVPGAFLLGIGFAAIYYYYPNLLLVSASHVAFNLFVIPF